VPGASRKVKRTDFDKIVSVLPVADPNIFSSAQRIQLAQMQLQMAQGAPQMHNMYEAYYRVYSALNIRDIDGILIPQNNQMPRDPASENSSVLNGMKLKAFPGQQHDAHIVAHLIMGMSPILQSAPMSAMELQQHIFEHVRIKAEEEANKSEAEKNQVIVAELIAQAATSGNPISVENLTQSGVELSDLPSQTPIELSNGVVITAEVAIEVELLQDPAAFITEAFTNPLAALSALGSVGADMTPKAREKSEKVVLSAIIAGNIATQAAATAAMATYRRNP
jgi:hypothetical protein